MSLLPLNEAFETIQGEAHWTGTPAVFVRLQGCDVGCPWCDTKHTWPLNVSKVRPLEEILAKTKDEDTYAMASVEEIVFFVLGRSAKHVVITGGEPCEYDLEELTGELIGCGLTVQVETSGTTDIRVNPKTWVTVSPKIDMPGGKTVKANAIFRADEIKMPVGKARDVDVLVRLLAPFEFSTPKLVWLQPLSTSKKATELCIEAATARGFRVSLQFHKFVGMR